MSGVEILLGDLSPGRASLTKQKSQCLEGCVGMDRVFWDLSFLENPRRSSVSVLLFFTPSMNL